MQSTAYQQELDRTRSFKSQLLKLESIVNKPGDTAQINQVSLFRFQLSGPQKKNAICWQVPLYICPPPPPIDSVNFSPTEETHLLSVLGNLDAMPTQVSCQYRNDRTRPTTQQCLKVTEKDCADPQKMSILKINPLNARPVLTCDGFLLCIC